MKKLVKNSLIVIVALLVVVIVAPSLLSGKISDIVKTEANKMLNAKLDFEKLGISLLRHFPNASLDLKGLTLVGVERFEGDTIVAAERISAVVSPLSLVTGDGIVIKKVLLNEPAIHALKEADGAVNWDVMKPTEEVETVEEESTGSSSFKLAVKDFRISDAVIRYEDDSTKMAFSTEPLNLRLKGDLSAVESELDLNLKLEQVRLKSGVVTMLSDAEIEFDAAIAANLEEQRFVFKKNTLRLNAIALTLDGWAQLLADEAIAMDLKLNTDKVQFKDVLSLIPA
ncbi:MAG: AsmA family protein, partial [Alistipes sp.]|nr:AsmA family protein [Alistipes sp.]